jgi:hypothetical protein
MESLGVCIFLGIVVMAVSLFYKPFRVFIADILFAISVFFGAFYQVFRVMSHDARNFEPTKKDRDVASEPLPEHFNCRSYISAVDERCQS